MNEYIIIPLSKTGKHAGKYEAFVSDEDKDLAEFNWNVFARPRDTLAYAKRMTHKE